MRALIGAMDDASRAADAERYIGLNIAFHATLYAATGNTRLAALDAQMGKELRIYRRHGLAFGGGLAVSNVEHRAILAAIERGRLRSGRRRGREAHPKRTRPFHPRDVGDRPTRFEGTTTGKPSRKRA